MVIVRTKKRPSRAGPSRKLISRRDTRASRKAELGRFFSAVDWSILDSAPNIDDRSRQLCDIITAGLDAIMPAVKSKVHLNDPPWITPEFKTLIAKRQQAFMSGDLASFRHLRNTVNRERKALRERFFASKVKHLKNTKPPQWWGEVKRITGMTPASGSDNLRSLLHVEGLDHHLPDRDVANAINSAFLDQMKSFSPLDATLPFEANSAVVTIVICVAYNVIWRKQKSPICNHKKCHQRGQISKHIIFDNRSFCFHLSSIPDSEPVGIFANNCKLFSSATDGTRHQGFTI